MDATQWTQFSHAWGERQENGLDSEETDIPSDPEYVPIRYHTLKRRSHIHANKLLNKYRETSAMIVANSVLVANLQIVME